ncbi:collagen alpha-1(I) chain-like [Lontra canadensis]|uniref:collagen alpha-1(I) chain-like n=1 Tax=Lontra canadensis TaxID=76717 RepID=UPI0013F36CF5|nr:collagen alpha-1(I) chain-like [Lontra canadensis]XP_032706237.1 collagen alpha-1(I) chain-like [Lontra canadensis]
MATLIKEGMNKSVRSLSDPLRFTPSSALRVPPWAAAPASARGAPALARLTPAGGGAVSGRPGPRPADAEPPHSPRGSGSEGAEPRQRQRTRRGASGARRVAGPGPRGEWKRPSLWRRASGSPAGAAWGGAPRSLPSPGRLRAVEKAETSRAAESPGGAGFWEEKLAGAARDGRRGRSAGVPRRPSPAPPAVQEAGSPLLAGRLKAGPLASPGRYRSTAAAALPRPEGGAARAARGPAEPAEDPEAAAAHPEPAPPPPLAPSPPSRDPRPPGPPGPPAGRLRPLRAPDPLA